jgi:hypothetical protein
MSGGVVPRNGVVVHSSAQGARSGGVVGRAARWAEAHGAGVKRVKRRRHRNRHMNGE